MSRGMWTEARYVSVSSAGTRGIMYFGAVDAYEEFIGSTAFAQWLHQLRGVAGTSAGAVVALVLFLELSRTVRRRVLEEFADARRMLDPNVALLAKGFGFENGAGLRQMVRQILNLGGLSPSCTLGDLQRFFKREFVCMTTDLRTAAPYALSSRGTPNVSVVEAVFASCCVPFVCTPPTIHERLLADGCLSSDVPDVFDRAETLYVRLDHTVPSGRIREWPDFMGAIVRCSVMAQEHLWRALEREAPPGRTLSLSSVGEVAAMPSFDMALGEVQRDKLHALGFASVLDVLHGGAPSAFVGEVVKLLLCTWVSDSSESCPPCAPDAAAPDARSPSAAPERAHTPERSP